MIYIFSSIILYIFLGLILYILQRRILFNKSGIPKHPSEYGLYSVKEILIQTQDGIDLLSWYCEGDKKLPLLLYFHGNSFDIGERAYRIKKYIDENWNVLIVSWRGFSGNKGFPNEQNLYLDAEATLKWIKNNTNFKLKEIVVYGESLGTGVAVEIGTRYQFYSIILEAPFTSIPDIAQKRYKIYPVKYLVKDKFDNYSKINKLKSPLLIISGKKDEIIPHSHSLKLLKRANEIKKGVFVDEAMHNNLYDFGIDKHVIDFNLKLWK
ncbi:MAG: alpha/beta hydrolase [Rickettsiales bacterium]|nr:alpha/beta hydrolase [Rickettsiales bacterium]